LPDAEWTASQIAARAPEHHDAAELGRGSAGSGRDLVVSDAAAPEVGATSWSRAFQHHGADELGRGSAGSGRDVVVSDAAAREVGATSRARALQHQDADELGCGSAEGGRDVAVLGPEYHDAVKIECVAAPFDG